MKWLCKFLPHRWEFINSNMYRNHTDRIWGCKRCGLKDIEKVWHDI